MNACQHVSPRLIQIKDQRAFTEFSNPIAKQPNATRAGRAELRFQEGRKDTLTPWTGHNQVRRLARSWTTY